MYVLCRQCSLYMENIKEMSKNIYPMILLYITTPFEDISYFSGATIMWRLLFFQAILTYLVLNLDFASQRETRNKQFVASSKSIKYIGYKTHQEICSFLSNALAPTSAWKALCVPCAPETLSKTNHPPPYQRFRASFQNQCRWSV